MKKPVGTVALIPILILLAAMNAVSRQTERIARPELTGPCLGQKPPGMTPEIFAPEIVSKEGDQGRLFIAGDGPVSCADRSGQGRNEHAGQPLLFRERGRFNGDMAKRTGLPSRLAMREAA
jgi:hypothetical protein